MTDCRDLSTNFGLPSGTQPNCIHKLEVIDDSLCLTLYDCSSCVNLPIPTINISGSWDSKTGTLTLTTGTGSPLVLNLSSLKDLYSISFDSGNLVLKDSSGNVISTVSIPDKDQQLLSLSGNTITISGGNSITLPPSKVVTGLGIKGDGLSATPIDLDLTELPFTTTPTSFVTGDNQKINLADTQKAVVTCDSVNANYSSSTAPIVGQKLLLDDCTKRPQTSLRIDATSQLTGVIPSSNLPSTVNNLTVTPTGILTSTVNGVAATVTLPDKDQQTLSLSSNTLSISNGNSVTLPATTNSLIISGTNPKTLVSTVNGVASTVTFPDLDVQTLSLTGSTLSISGGNSVTLPPSQVVTGVGLSGNGLTANPITLNLSGLPTGTASPTSTFVTGSGQQVSVASMQATLVTCASVNANYLSSTAPITTQNLLLDDCTKRPVSSLRIDAATQLTGSIPVSNLPTTTNTLTVSGTTTKTLVSTVNGVSATVNVVDLDAQTLTLTGNTLSISNGNSVTLPTTPATTNTLTLSGTTTKTLVSTVNGVSATVSFPDIDSQTLTLTGNTLSISGGNSINLPASPTTHTTTWTQATGLVDTVNGVVTTIPIPVGTPVSDIGYNAAGNPIQYPVVPITQIVEKVVNTSTNITLTSTTTTVGITTTITVDSFVLVSAAATITLPAGSSVPIGTEIDVKKTGVAVYSITVTTTVGAVDGGFNVTFGGTTARQSRTFRSDGLNWWVV
jgi:hypothetical protein